MVLLKVRRKAVPFPRYFYHAESDCAVVVDTEEDLRRLVSTFDGALMSPISKEKYDEVMLAASAGVADAATPVLTPKKKPALPEQPPLWDLYRDGVTQSVLTSFLTCPEKCRLGLIEGLTPLRVSGALAFGNLFHEMLDLVYSAEREGAPYDVKALLAGIEERDRAVLLEAATDEYSMEDFEENIGMAEPLLAEYFKQWGSDFSQYQWESLEEVFEAKWSDAFACPGDPTFGPPIFVRGKFDGIFRMHGKLWLFETKTKSRIEDSHIADSLSYNFQVMVYLWAAKQVYGERVHGVVYNLVRRPQLRRGKGQSVFQFCDRVALDIQERPEFYFTRLNCTVPESDQKEFEKRFDAIMTRFLAWARNIEKNNFKWQPACGAPYPCQFLPICSGSGDRKKFKRRLEVFPELAIGAEAGE